MNSILNLLFLTIKHFLGKEKKLWIDVVANYEAEINFEQTLKTPFYIVTFLI